jgi:serine/threonine-protein kinase
MFKIFFSDKQKKDQQEAFQAAKTLVISSDTHELQDERKEITDILPGYCIANKYEVIQKLGEGGFGATFLVRDLTKSVSVTYVAKLQKLGLNAKLNADLLQRFNQEAKTLDKLGSSHGQIPSLIDFFDFEGNFYLIQEFIQGPTLMGILVDKLANNSVFEEKKAIQIILSLLEVLESVHEAQIIHRDLKPDNVILRTGDGKPVLIDFGIIKDVAVSNLGETGTIIGTPGYCPFEQSMGKPLFQSDLYAVGMILLVLMTGIAPYRLPVTNDFQIDFSSFENNISSGLLDWLKIAISVLPQNRFESATQMRESLQNIYNLEYVAKNIKNTTENNQNKIQQLQSEIQILKNQLQQVTSQTEAKNKALISALKAVPSVVEIPESAPQIITTQLEIDAFNIVKKLFDNNGLATDILHIKDAVEYCDININSDESKTLIRLYFNDEENLSFALILADGKEDKFSIKTIDEIRLKQEQIIPRAKQLINDSKPKVNSGNSLLDIASKELGF